MHTAVPVIHAATDQPTQVRSRERHPVKRQRLHARYLLASGQARFRSELASLRGINRTTVGRWLERYAQGGWDAVLERYLPPGKAAALPPEHGALLQQALMQPQGCGSYAQARQWLSDTCGVALTDTATPTLVRSKRGATLKGARPSHIQKR